MNLRWSGVLSLAILVGAAWIAAPMSMAQEQSQNGPPNYVFAQDLSLKPGSTAEFVKLQQEEVTAMREAKAPGYFEAMGQLTGTGRLSFIEGYDSFAEGQKEHEQVMSNTQLAATLKTDNEAQDALVRNEYDSVYKFRRSLSLHSDQSLVNMRFMDVDVVHVRPGHIEEFESIAKAEAKALASDANVHWAVFQKIYGEGSGDTFIVSVPMKSLSEIDTMIANRKEHRDTAGEGLVHLVQAAEANTILSADDNLYVFSQKMSYVPDAWLSASPDFWGKK